LLKECAAPKEGAGTGERDKPDARMTGCQRGAGYCFLLEPRWAKDDVAEAKRDIFAHQGFRALALPSKDTLLLGLPYAPRSGFQNELHGIGAERKRLPVEQPDKSVERSYIFGVNLIGQRKRRVCLGLHARKLLYEFEVFAGDQIKVRHRYRVPQVTFGDRDCRGVRAAQGMGEA